MRLIPIDLVGPVIDSQHGSASDPNLAFAAAPLRQPEVSSLRACIANQRPRNPERWILRRRASIFATAKSVASTQTLPRYRKLAFPSAAQHSECRPGAHPGSHSPATGTGNLPASMRSPLCPLRPLFRCPSPSSELSPQESSSHSETQCENFFLKWHQSRPPPPCLLRGLQVPGTRHGIAAPPGSASIPPAEFDRDAPSTPESAPRASLPGQVYSHGQAKGLLQQRSASRSQKRLCIDRKT
jgi:hypothetical protein